MSGIVRRIDDLGRIVIPKEIRRSLKIKNGEALEIESNNQNIVLKRYSDFLDIENMIDNITSVCGKLINKDILVFDGKNIISQYKVDIEDIKHKDISDELYKLISSRKSNYNYKGSLKITGEIGEEGNFLFTSIIPNGDVIGGVLIYSKSSLDNNSEMILKILNDILEKYIEE